MEKITKNLSKSITALVVLIVGILCIVAGAASGEASINAYEGISITLGVSLLIVALLALILAFAGTVLTKGKTPFGATAIASSVTLALGIFFISDKGLGGELIWLFLNFVPYVLIVVGSIVVIDAIIVIVYGFINKNSKPAVISGTVSIIIGVLALVLGALMVGNNPVISKNAQLIIFGVVIILYALTLCCSILLNVLNKKEVVYEVKFEDVKEENQEEEK